VLQQTGLCTNQDFERARLGAIADGHLRADKVLIPLGLVKERELATVYARVLGLSLVEPSSYPEFQILPDIFPASFARENRSIILGFDGDVILVALSDPLDCFVKEVIFAKTGRAVRMCVSVPIELDSAIRRLYPPSSTKAVTDFGIQSSAALDKDIERLRDMASEAPIIRLVNDIVTRAVETHASDIHLEPYSTDLRIRYRYDGLLFDEGSRPFAEGPAIISRIKIMAKLDIAERRIPQDGRIQMSVRGTEIDFRVSTVPSANGEAVVLRILDRSAIRLDFERIGLERQTVLAFQEALLSPNGTVLVTGPTGCGKTTTLYAGLAALVDTKRNVISIEDPIEYHLDGVRQIQTQSQIGLNFSEILRSVLRQDPDIIMVGEMRDTETATTALQAALTGHLVLSTLHTNSAAGAITRLRDMGVEPYLVAELLVGVLAQRLVRRLCDHCKRERRDTQQKLADSSLHFLQLDYANQSLWEAVGCPSCRNTGYRGRLAIGEFLQPSQALKGLILCNADERTIRIQATKDGMKSMFRCGIDRALNGVTTIDEVLRHVRRDDQY
jgi:general secretion pathway protein E